MNHGQENVRSRDNLARLNSHEKSDRVTYRLIGKSKATLILCHDTRSLLERPLKQQVAWSELNV